MNKKMMAIFMSALMVVAAMCIVVASPSDAVGNTTEDSAKYIIGNKENPLITTYDDVGVTGSIKFNLGVFSTVAKVMFEYEDGNSHKQLIIGANNILSEENTVIGTLTISASTGDGNEGKYSIALKGTANNDFRFNKIIRVTVEDYICKTNNHNDNHDGCEVLSRQSLYYGINARIISTNQEIRLDKWIGTDDEPQKFFFEQSVKFKASVISARPDEKYRFYATGLPKGISMNVDGSIGGMLSNDETNGNKGTATVYATFAGNVFSKNFKWEIDNKPEFPAVNFKMKIGNTEIPDKGHYIAKGEKVTLTLVGEGNYDYVVTGKDVVIGTDGDGYTILKELGPNDSYGAGAFVVTVTAKKTVNGYTKAVTESFTVYVVGSIVDADLSPTVTSK